MLRVDWSADAEREWRRSSLAPLSDAALLGSILGLPTAAAARLSERVRNGFGWHAREWTLLSGCTVSEADEKDIDDDVEAALLL